MNKQSEFLDLISPQAGRVWFIKQLLLEEPEESVESGVLKKKLELSTRLTFISISGKLGMQITSELCIYTSVPVVG